MSVFYHECRGLEAMSNLNHPGYVPKPKAKLNLTTTMNELLYTVVSTQKGWVLRQVIKWTTVGGTALTTWLVAHSVSVDGAAITAALATLATGLVEAGLSKVASKIAAK